MTMYWNAVTKADIIDLDDIRERQSQRFSRFIAETAQKKKIAVARKLFL